ncbi:hypothetical protein [Enterobacter sp. MGH 3]|uniref:hypothetical protein n=1 Tax=Enterobacter sp. MGH 3 TaxID=1329812 RepID=UPI0012DDC792|nr:hypothetical protein [Enterobacter sp. MGH 3]
MYGAYSFNFSLAGLSCCSLSVYEDRDVVSGLHHFDSWLERSTWYTLHAGFKGRIIRVHASKGKYARAEPISALYVRDYILNHGVFSVVDDPLMASVPASGKLSADLFDAMVYALTELNGSQPVGMMIPKRLR